MNILNDLPRNEAYIIYYNNIKNLIQEYIKKDLKDDVLNDETYYIKLLLEKLIKIYKINLNISKSSLNWLYLYI